jgi:hypothetical protein
MIVEAALDDTRLASRRVHNGTDGPVARAIACTTEVSGSLLLMGKDPHAGLDETKTIDGGHQPA